MLYIFIMTQGAVKTTALCSAASHLPCLIVSTAVGSYIFTALRPDAGPETTFRVQRRTVRATDVADKPPGII